MRRWLVAVVGLGIALVAIYALVTGVFVADEAAKGEEIDSRSREGLRELLKEAE